jgi:hypothetical protein
MTNQFDVTDRWRGMWVRRVSRPDSAGWVSVERIGAESVGPVVDVRAAELEPARECHVCLRPTTNDRYCSQRCLVERWF